MVTCVISKEKGEKLDVVGAMLCCSRLRQEDYRRTEPNFEPEPISDLARLCLKLRKQNSDPGERGAG